MKAKTMKVVMLGLLLTLGILLSQAKTKAYSDWEWGAGKKTADGDYTYHISANDNSVWLEYYHGDGAATITIPSEIEGKPVTTIGMDAEYLANNNIASFWQGNYKGDSATESQRGLDKIEKVIVPSTVTYFQERTFTQLTGLKEVNIPEKVTVIPWFTFDKCSSLKEINLPANVFAIGEGAFRGCSALTKVTIPSAVNSLVFEMFKGCSNLTEVTVLGDVTYIDPTAFRECYKLAKLGFGLNNYKRYLWKDGTIFRFRSGEKVLVSTVKKLGAKYKIPNGVVEIGEDAFSEVSGVKEITFPSSLKIIGNTAFCNAKDLTIVKGQKNLTKIGHYAFAHTKLKKFAIPKTLKTLGEGVFATPTIEKFTIAKGNKYFAIKNNFLFNKKGTILYFGIVKKSSAVIDKKVKEFKQFCFISKTSKKLKKITFKGTKVPTFRENSLFEKALKIYVPKNSKKKYQKALIKAFRNLNAYDDCKIIGV